MYNQSARFVGITATWSTGGKHITKMSTGCELEEPRKLISGHGWWLAEFPLKDNIRR